MSSGYYYYYGHYSKYYRSRLKEMTIAPGLPRRRRG